MSECTCRKCGKTFTPEKVETVKADLVFCDPPYNVAYRGERPGGGKLNDGIENDDMAPEQFIEFSCAFMDRIAAAAKTGAAIYICSGYSSYPPFLFALKRAGMTFSSPIIWVKQAAVPSFSDYKRQHEWVLKARKGKLQNPTAAKLRAQPIIYGWNAGRHYFAEDRYEADVWEIKRTPSANMVHPTQKPLALVQRAIRNSSQAGWSVLDPFGGSGSTLIAAEREGRRARVMDIDPRYVDTMIRRYAAQGLKSEREIRDTRRNVLEAQDRK